MHNRYGIFMVPIAEIAFMSLCVAASILTALSSALSTGFGSTRSLFKAPGRNQSKGGRHERGRQLWSEHGSPGSGQVALN